MSLPVKRTLTILLTLDLIGFLTVLILNAR